MGEPFFSVIVLAYDRKQYVEGALRSVLEQTLSRELFEIILVTNLEIDPGLIESGGIRVIHSDVKSIGMKTRIGLASCQGEVVCLLDDDDQWMATKLEKMYSFFIEHPEIGYVHNGMAFMDERGQSVNPKGQLASWKAGAGDVLWSHPLGGAGPPRSLNSMASFNCSCISMRRDNMLKLTDFLEQMTSGVDKFLFYGAVCQDCGIYSTSEELTRYRVHESFSSVYHMVDFSAFCLKQAKNTAEYLYDFKVIHEMCCSFKALDLQRETEILCTWFKFNSDLFRPRSRKLLMNDLFHSLKLLVSVRLRNRWLATISVLSLISLFWKDVPRHVLFSYYSRS